MGTIYLRKKDVSIDSEDNWIWMNKTQYDKFLETPEGQSRKDSFRELLKADSHDSTIIIEANKEKGAKVDADRDHAKYVYKRNAKVGYEIVPYGVFQIDGEELAFEETIPDENCDVEAEAIRRIEIENLRKVVPSLSKDDNFFILGRFFNETKTSEREYAKMLNETRHEIRERIKGSLLNVRSMYLHQIPSPNETKQMI